MSGIPEGKLGIVGKDPGNPGISMGKAGWLNVTPILVQATIAIKTTLNIA
jgi:hypothetical protein